MTIQQQVLASLPGTVVTIAMDTNLSHTQIRSALQRLYAQRLIFPAERVENGWVYWINLTGT